MATASSVQREPSMEEILASIRRIIEDSDPGRKQPETGDELKQDLEPDMVEKPEAEVEAFRAELRGSLETRKPFTLADVQAKMAAEQSPAASDPVDNSQQPVRSPLTLAEVGTQAGVKTSDSDGPALKTAYSADTIVADWRRDIANAAQPVQAAPAAEVREEPVFDLASDIDIYEDELTPEAPPLAAAQPTFTDSSPADEEPALRPAIVSEHTGRQVAAAFGELSEAFASRSKKSFDDMAQEMLRPMLQDWLDNNLPTLVERLVREEIERVARGA
ncbi:MAG TPA: PopZ family protein [Mesorhizobium sp.]